MPTFRVNTLARSALFILALCGAMQASALPVADLRAEDLLPMAAEFKKGLNLNPNQLTLWNQVEAKSRSLLRERQQRRELLQKTSLQALAAGKVELRDLSPAVEADADLSAKEQKQLREWWLTVNDALDEPQRQQVAKLLAEELLRVPEVASAKPREGGHGEGGQHSGKGRGRPGAPGSGN